MYKISGHCLITDEANNVILDKTNDIHPGNFARAISRSLANESSYWINSMAFGWGATIKKYDGTYTKYSPNDGIAPDYAGWKSSLYNETFRKYLDPISLGSNTTIEDAITPPVIPITTTPIYTETHRNTNGVVSYVDNNKSIVEINCILDVDEPDDGKVLTFDEIALYTGPVYSTISSYQDVMVDTSINTIYSSGNILTITIKVDDSTFMLSFTVTGSTYDDIVNNLNKKLRNYYCYAELKSDRIRFHNNYKVVKIVSSSFLTGLTINDTVIVDNPKSLASVAENGTFKNNPMTPDLEKPRLLTHLIFEPIDKPRLSTYYIKYKLTIEVEPTPKKDNNLEFVLPNDYRMVNTYEYNAVLPSRTWVVFHQLGYTPRVDVFNDGVMLVKDNDYSLSYGDAGTENAADNQVTIRFKVPQTGTARFY
jgi:hypothetical protein